jgi:hypothetical protein
MRRLIRLGRINPRCRGLENLRMLHIVRGIFFANHPVVNIREYLPRDIDNPLVGQGLRGKRVDINQCAVGTAADAQRRPRKQRA